MQENCEFTMRYGTMGNGLVGILSMSNSTFRIWKKDFLMQISKLCVCSKK